jgi:hypothetical protein
VTSTTRPAEESADRPERADRWVFWLLFTLAAVAFAPCVIVPVWLDYGETRQAEQRQLDEVRRAQAEVDRQRRLAEALRSDPAVIARAAQRELEYTIPGQLQVDVAPDRASPQDEAVDPAESAAADPPIPPLPIARYLPKLNYRAVFCDPQTRLLIALMSGGLLVTAFVLFPPRRRPRARHTA